MQSHFIVHHFYPTSSCCLLMLSSPPRRWSDGCCTFYTHTQNVSCFWTFSCFCCNTVYKYIYCSLHTWKKSYNSFISARDSGIVVAMAKIAKIQFFLRLSVHLSINTWLRRKCILQKESYRYMRVCRCFSNCTKMCDKKLIKLKWEWCLMSNMKCNFLTTTTMRMHTYDDNIIGIGIHWLIT